MAKDIKPTNEQVLSIFNEVILDYQLYQVDKPKVLIVAGVSGSGKSTLITKLIERSRLNFFPIQADDYRKLHPKIKEFREKYGFDEAHKKTGNFAHRFATELLALATEKKLNVLYETTFGNIDTATNLLSFFKEKNYEIIVFALPANVELSIKRNQQRYQDKILAQSSLPRIVEKSVIERMAINYVECIQQIQKDDEILLFHINDSQNAQETLRKFLEI